MKGNIKITTNVEVVAVYTANEVSKILGVSRATAYRIIDKFNEGIDTMLFKKSEEYLTSQDGFNSWYLVYKNQNDPATSGDKEADYVNPVKLFITSDEGYTITQNSSLVLQVTIRPEDLPLGNNVEEFLWINKTMSNLL